MKSQDYTKYKEFYEMFGTTATAAYSGISTVQANKHAKKHGWKQPNKEVQVKHTINMYMELLETKRQLDVLKNVINKAI